LWPWGPEVSGYRGSYVGQVDISIGEADHEDVAKGEVDRMIQAALNKAALRGVEMICGRLALSSLVLQNRL